MGMLSAKPHVRSERGCTRFPCGQDSDRDNGGLARKSKRLAPSDKTATTNPKKWDSRRVAIAKTKKERLRAHDEGGYP
jgi:hypothetical protein